MRSLHFNLTLLYPSTTTILQAGLASLHDLDTDRRKWLSSCPLDLLAPALAPMRQTRMIAHSEPLEYRSRAQAGIREGSREAALRGDVRRPRRSGQQPLVSLISKVRQCYAADDDRQQHNEQELDTRSSLVHTSHLSSLKSVTNNSYKGIPP